MKANKILYSIDISDIQEVAVEILERKLTTKEINIVEIKLGDYIDWFGAIENSISKMIQDKQLKVAD